jgi:AraC-like DNA-binding protein
MLGGVMGGIAVVAATSSGPVRSGLFAFLDLAMLVMFLATLQAAWGGLADDLDAGRRRRRIFLLKASALLGALITVSALTMSLAAVPSGLRTSLQTLITASIFAAAFALCVTTLRPSEIEPRARPASGARTPLSEKILLVLERDKLYREADITVARLAHALSAPEHQVRAAINAELGFKNFSTFINGYRLAEVKAALADPTQLETPISTIALDAGFGSIATFNRVFKTEHGMSPRDFRRESTT